MMARNLALGIACGVAFLWSGSPVMAASEPELAVWVNYTREVAEITEALPALAEQGVVLNLNIPHDIIGDEEVADVIWQADAFGVEVRAWLTLSVEQGLWAGESNVVAVSQVVMNFMDWAEVAALPVDWIIFDLEMNYDRTMQMNTLGEALVQGEEGALADVVSFFKENSDPLAFDEAAVAYETLVDTIHSRGFYAQATTYPQILDDLADGDGDLQDILDVVLWTDAHPIEWDRVSFMVYRTSFGQELFTPDLIYRYGRHIARRFGDRGAIDLGVIGYDVFTGGGYTEVSDLRADYSAALASGVGHLSAYSWQGAVEMTPACATDVCPWWSLDSVTPARPPADPLVVKMRAGLMAIDGVLNAVPRQ